MLRCRRSRNKILNFKMLLTSTSNTWEVDLVKPISLPKTRVTTSETINLTKALSTSSIKSKKHTALTPKYTKL